MKLGISGQALGYVMPFADIIRTGKKYGIKDYEIWPCNVGANDDYGLVDLSETKELLEREEVRLYCVTLSAGYSSAAADPQVYRDYLIHAIDAAAFLGAKVVNHYCCNVCPGDVPDFDRMEKYWRAPLEYAAERGIVLALENEAHDCTGTPEKMLQIMEHFRHPHFKTNFDAVNYFHASCEGFPGAYMLLKPYIGYVHIKNACLQDSRWEQPTYNSGAPMSGFHAPNPIQYAPIPRGAVNIPGLLSQLEADGIYHGVCTLEPHTAPKHVEAFYAEESAWLKKLGFFPETFSVC